MSTGLQVVVWVVFALAVAAPALLLILVGVTDRHPMPEGVGLKIDGEPEQALAAIVAAPPPPVVPPLPRRETQPIPEGRIFTPAPLVHGPTLPPYVEGWGVSGRCEPTLIRTAETPAPIGEAPIFDALEREWPSLFYRRELLHQATREFKILVGLTWTQAELDDLSRLAEPCSHCGAAGDQRADEPADHTACPGCACPCTLEVEVSHVG